jgi:hypothetical protein
MNSKITEQANKAITLRGIVNGFQKSRIVLTAFELDLFTILHKTALTSEDIARISLSDAKYTDRLLNALCALELLVKEDNKFMNSPLAEEFLVKGNPFYMAGLMHSAHLWHTWSNLTQTIKTGKPAAPEAINNRGDDWLVAFIAAMHDRARQQASDSVALINLDNVKNILDLGGGSGAFAMAFVNARKGISATVFDLPNVTPITDKYIRENGFKGKISTLTGDYTRDDIGKGYDLIFLSAVIHSNSGEVNKKLIAKCAAALNSGGQLVIQDHIMSEDRTQPLMGAIFAINMLVGTQDGDTYTSTEIEEWMKKAGLSGCKIHQAPQGLSQMIGFKL